ncbi:MAG: mechanosensitive ion channel [Gallionella sp.]|nr:mechanosensitive ion channel [Gallionella sp.]
MKNILALILCLMFVNPSWAARSQPAAVASAPIAVSAVAASAPLALEATSMVTLAGEEIFRVQASPVASLSVQARVNLIKSNIQTFADSKVDIKKLKVLEGPEGAAIGTADGVLLVITEQDAKLENKTTLELAISVLGKVQTAVEDYRTKHTWKTYAIGAAFSILSIIGLWQALLWNSRAFEWLTRKALTVHDFWKSGIHFKGIEVLSSTRIENIVLLALKSLRIFVVLLCLYFFLPLILSFFPETRKLSSTIFDYLLTPFASIFYTLVKYIPNLFYIFVIGVIANYILKLISYVFTLIEHGDLKFDWFYEDWARPTYQIVRFLVIVTALISAYPYIPGSSSEAFQGVGLVLGAIISFASSSAISNIVAGVILTYTRAFRLNDRIQVGETVGDVVEKTLLVTRVKTIKHVVITIPNSLVMGTQIINFSTSAAEGRGVILHTSVTIGYDVAWKQVESLLIAAALKTDKLLKTPAPFVLQTSLDDWYVAYEINAYTKEPELMAVIYSELHKNIQEEFDVAGVEIMSPHYMTLRDGNASTVPSVLGAPGYTTPAFTVRDVK